LCEGTVQGLDRSTQVSYEEMLRDIKYVLDTNTQGLRIVPDNNPMGTPWNINCFTDSVNDPVTQNSITGYDIYVHGLPVV